MTTPTASPLVTNYAASGTDLGTLLQPALPVGSILMFAGTTLPDNFMWCDGTAYDTATYATLFGLLGYTYGGSGASFNVPDLRKRVPIGASSPADALNISYQGSSALASGNSVMTTAQLASHAHPPASIANASGIVTFLDTDPGSNVATAANGLNISFDSALDTGFAGSSQEFLPPFLVLNFIIKFN